MFQMCGVFAEFERSMIRERIMAGQARAKSQGKHIGRPSNLNDGIVHSVKYMREQGLGIRKIARDLQVGVSTVYKVLGAGNQALGYGLKNWPRGRYQRVDGQHIRPSPQYSQHQQADDGKLIDVDDCVHASVLGGLL